ncbi:HU family DNA-binding protein, partial [Pseudomonadota bacterium]|nr:HU family DNA-binding protein [Pseudomonadota bacterium]
MSTTKKTLTKIISSKINLSQKDSKAVIDNFFRFISDHHSRPISINNFGKFLFKKTPKRIGRNPKS